MELQASHDFSRLPQDFTGHIPHRLVRRTVTIDAHEVRMTERGLLPAQPLVVPLSDFTGVRRRAGMAHGVAVFFIELVHEGTGVAYHLARSSNEEAARAAWLEIARTTGLPAIDESATGTVTRQGPELDWPLRNLAEAGALSVPPADPPDPSWPLRWGRSGEARARPPWPEGTTDVSLPVVGPGVMLAFALLIGSSGFLCLHGFQGGMVAMLEAVRLLYCVQTALLLAILVLMLGERRHVAVTRRSVTLCSTWFGRRRNGGITLPLDAIDTVTHPARRIAFGAGSMLIVAAGTAGFTIADLSARQARWIGRFVMAAAVGDPWVYEMRQPAAAPTATDDTKDAAGRPCAA